MTIGEVLSLRTLNYTDQGYVTGQQGARMQGPEHAQLTYADNHGFLVIMPCQVSEQYGGDMVWSPMSWFLRCSLNGNVEVYSVPLGFALSTKMLAALNLAKKRYDERQ